MATHRTPSPITDNERSSASPGSPSESGTAEVHHRSEIPSAYTSTQQPGNLSGTGSTNDYGIIPSDEEESPEEIHGSSSTNSRHIDDVNLNETEKINLPYQPLDKVATLKQWTWEFVALFSSMAAFVAMVILLVISDGKPQPEWAYDLNINTLIAVLATLLRAAMLFILAEGIMFPPLI